MSTLNVCALASAHPWRLSAASSHWSYHYQWNVIINANLVTRNSTYSRPPPNVAILSQVPLGRTYSRADKSGQVLWVATNKYVVFVCAGRGRGCTVSRLPHSCTYRGTELDGDDQRTPKHPPAVVAWKQRTMWVLSQTWQHFLHPCWLWTEWLAMQITYGLTGRLYGIQDKR